MNLFTDILLYMCELDLLIACSASNYACAYRHTFYLLVFRCTDDRIRIAAQRLNKKKKKSMFEKKKKTKKTKPLSKRDLLLMILLTKNKQTNKKQKQKQKTNKTTTIVNELSSTLLNSAYQDQK